jgi:hypothetical protein
LLLRSVLLVTSIMLVYTSELAKKKYSLQQLIIRFANVDVSRHILVVDTSVLAKRSNIDRME